MITEATMIMKKARGNFFKASSSSQHGHHRRRNFTSSIFMANFSLCLLWTILLVKTAPSHAIVNHKSSSDYVDVDYYDNSGVVGDEGIVNDQGMASSGQTAFASSGILVDSSSTAQMFPYKEINFISPSQELAQSRWWYDAPLSFSAKGMDHLYLLNNFLMDLIQPSGLPEEIVRDQLFTDPIPLLNDNRQKVRTTQVHRTLSGKCVILRQAWVDFANNMKFYCKSTHKRLLKVAFYFFSFKSCWL